MMPWIEAKTWDGDPDEVYRTSDVGRVRQCQRLLAGMLGTAMPSYDVPTPTKQFDYHMAQAVEEANRALGQAAGVQVPYDASWGPARPLSYVDFERWEDALFRVYKALGGPGERLTDTQTLDVFGIVLRADDWTGTGPWTQDIYFEPSDELYVYGAHEMTVAQRAAEFNAILQVTSLGDGMLRATAAGVRPETDIILTASKRCFDLFKSFTIPASGWTGTGPWTQDLDLEAQVSDAVIGADDRNSTEQWTAAADAVMSVSAIAGTVITVRAIGTKPAVDIYATVGWHTEATS